MNLHTGYDAWRLNPPEDRLSRFAPDTIEAPFILDLEEGYVETIATVDAEYGEIVSVRLGGLELSPTQAEQILGAVRYNRQLAHIEHILPDLIEGAAREAAEHAAEWLYDSRSDD